MRHVRDVMRLKSAGMSTREIARRMGTVPSTVRLTIRRFEAAELSWPLPDDITDTELEARLFASAGAGPGTRRGHRRQAEPDWAAVHRELRRKHVTLAILWEVYIAGEPGGYRYSRFCELYRAWEGRLSVTMRQSHAAGDKLFVDYAGDGVPVVIDRRTGEQRSAQIFVAVLGASIFTYAQATWTQGLADWISGHVGAFEAIGGVPALLVPIDTHHIGIRGCEPCLGLPHIGALGQQVGGQAGVHPRNSQPVHAAASHHYVLGRARDEERERRAVLVALSDQRRQSRALDRNDARLLRDIERSAVPLLKRSWISLRMRSELSTFWVLTRMRSCAPSTRK
jgi:transposase